MRFGRPGPKRRDQPRIIILAIAVVLMQAQTAIPKIDLDLIAVRTRLTIILNPVLDII